MNFVVAIVQDSFDITGRGILVQLQHTQNGLEKETELVSENTGKIWKVMSRVLFDHAVSVQKMFQVESASHMLMSFSSSEKRQQSIDGIKESESQNIYHYLLTPVGHEDKPIDKERLMINITQINNHSE